ncbi:helix-turn-helix domain-containing protein [Tsukamurella tyrosinosolvens]|uniref:helix-turn-helix domain-containing protein n=1 Tax=Tsukamurella tyrosinosolvens TaxID=57704 RepID=UPI0009ED2A5F|nr:helix-turn-helix transcriptional regulator [Tsukamurella tyrosinosolvens]
MSTANSKSGASLGRTIANRRIATGRSSRSVARESNIDISTYTKIERGIYKSPKPQTLKAIAAALNIPLLELFRAAEYITPYDLVDLVTAGTTDSLPKEALDERSISRDQMMDARSQYIANIIEKYGLDYIEPGTDP